ncbi:MAG: leucine-rich repeat domain-containing protein [Clostridia bacterium]|nr:leucine-rich repeat domain-containing protein [Clostridia bacterium]
MSIVNYAFAGCYSLTTIVMPANVTSIGAYAFNNCVNLTSIDLTACDDLATIGEYAFLNCESLTSIIIPASVTSIGDYAFSGCTGLKTVYDLSTELEIVKGATDNGRVAYYAENVYNTLPTNEG